MATPATVHCPACDKPTRAYSELDPGRGVVRRCGNDGCNAGLPPEGASVVASPVLTLVKGGASAAPVASPAPAAGGPLAWDDMVAGLRARRVVILARLEEARTLQIELNRINQVLAVDDLPQAAE